MRQLFSEEKSDAGSGVGDDPGDDEHSDGSQAANSKESDADGSQEEDAKSRGTAKCNKRIRCTICLVYSTDRTG
jgi:hypothetical protein